MAVATTGSRASRPQGGRPRSERNDASAKVDAALLIKAKLVADARGITLAEYISETLRTPLERDFAREVRKLGVEAE